MGHIVIASGGTGGHLFPAIALANELVTRGHEVSLFTDSRGKEFDVSFPGVRYEIEAATLSVRRPLSWIPALNAICRGRGRAVKLLKTLHPIAVVGFGGYPSLPSVLAAKKLRIPIVLHEANRVVGRANRLLARFAALVATSHEHTQGLTVPDDRVVLTGNPLRWEVIEASQTPYIVPEVGGAFQLLVFGGSQGASVFSQVVPEAIKLLSQDMRSRLRIVHQVRLDETAKVLKSYRDMGCEVEVASFFSDIPKRMAKAHLVLCRSGASSVAEITAIGRPAIFIPFPHALDNDQKKNAARVVEAGGGWMIEQGDFTPDTLYSHLEALLRQPAKLGDVAGHARRLGRLDAGRQLADAVLQIAQQNSVPTNE